MAVATTTTETNRQLRLPARSGRVMPGAARALYLASLAASTDESRPVLCDVLWEGGDQVTRAVGTDTYRLMVVEVERTRAGLKPPPARSWGLYAAAVRQAYRLQEWRHEGLGFGIERAGDDCTLIQRAGPEVHPGGPRGWARQGVTTFPNWPNVVPDNDEQVHWRATVRLGELARLLRKMASTYCTRSSWGPRAIITPEPGAVAIWPSIAARLDCSKRSWPVPWVGGEIEALSQDVRQDQPIAVNAQLAAEPLWRAAEWLGAEQPVEIVVRGQLYQLTFTARPEQHECRELLFIVMAMELGEIWAQQMGQKAMELDR